MNKETIEIERDENFPSGYGKFAYLREDSSEILDKLIEWSRRNNHKIYKHKIRYIEEKAGELGKYNFDEKQWYPKISEIGYNIEKCHLVCYLDIYYQ